MKKGILVLTVLGIGLLSGCPELGIENPVAQGNTLVVHNRAHGDHGEEVNISRVSVVLVPDECSSDKPEGINLLPEPIPYGGSFAINGFADGRYWCRSSEGGGYVTLSGGYTTDWYVQ